MTLPPPFGCRRPVALPRALVGREPSHHIRIMSQCWRNEDAGGGTVEERLTLYEAGRGEFAELVASMRRRLDAAHDAVAARHDYFMAQAMLWMAVGARPELVRGAGEGEKR